MKVVVVGAGHNGLTAAAWLARSGHEVVICEARDRVGGLAAPEPFGEGFSAPVLHDTETVRPWAVEGMDVPFADPAPVRVWDGEWKPLPGLPFVDRMRDVALSMLDTVPPEIGEEAAVWPLARRALAVRRMGREDMLELLRVGPTCADDWLGETIDDPAVRAALIAPSLTGSWMGPRSPMSSANLLLRASLSGRAVAGGPAALVDALLAACRGVAVRTGAEVTRIEVSDGAVQGVVAGDHIEADAVVAAIGPRRALLGLVDPLQLPALVERDLTKVRVRGITAKVHLALSEPWPVERFCVVSDPLDLERAFDDAKHRRLPSRPPPVQGRAFGDVVSLLVHGVPHDLDGGWSDDARATVLDAVLATLERAHPGVRDAVVAHDVLAPPDLEARFGLEGGHPYHGEHALDQLWALRPTPALSRYSTPVRGLFLGSSGCHPGGGLTCAPGALAARAVV